jgi:hypothetical protein
MQAASIARALLALFTGLWPVSAMAQGDAKDIIAAQLRSQGYACSNPISATRDPKTSKPNATVWILVCENATYRATLVPNLAAQVEVVTDNKDGSPASE